VYLGLGGASGARFPHREGGMARRRTGGPFVISNFMEPVSGRCELVDQGIPVARPQSGDPHIRTFGRFGCHH
jgi:hypothetical protein